MEQKDYILREIEKIGVVLRYLIGKMIPSKSVKKKDISEKINTELFENIGYKISSLLNISKSKFNETFNYNKGFNYENIELLAELFYNISEKNTNSSKKILQKSLELYEYVNELGKTFSFDRKNKIAEIKNKLKLYKHDD
jgi:methionyl-tRNA synthetase